MPMPRFVRPALLSVLAAAALYAPAAGATGIARMTTDPKPVFGFIADDYSRALAEARARKLPLFIESWAPW